MTSESDGDESSINFAGLPPQQGFKIDYRSLGGYDLHPDGVEGYELSGDEPMMDIATRPLGTNEFHISYTEGEPGAAIPWHTHTPIMHQAYIPLEGEVRVNYKDNEGEVHNTEAGPGDMVYLPAGAHNKIEVIGDTRLRMLVVERETLITRVEHLIGESKGIYDPINDPEYGLELDSLRGNVVQMDDEVVEPY